MRRVARRRCERRPCVARVRLTPRPRDRALADVAAASPTIAATTRAAPASCGVDMCCLSTTAASAIVTGTSTVTSSDAVDGPTSRTPLRNDVTAKTEPTSAAPTRQANPAGPPTVPSEPSRPPATKNVDAAPSGQVGRERHRIGVAQQPVGEKDVDRVRRGRAEGHADPDEVGIRRRAADERDARRRSRRARRAADGSDARGRSSRRRRRRARDARSGRATRAAPTCARASRRRAPSRARRRSRRARTPQSAARSGIRSILRPASPTSSSAAAR